MINDIKSKDNFSVLIPDGESDHALSVLRCLIQTKNISIYILSNDPWVRVRFSRYPVQFITYLKKEGNEGHLAAIYEIVKKNSVDIILPVDEQTIRLLSEHKQAILNLTAMVSVPGLNSFDIAVNKWALSKWLNGNHIPSPSTILYKTDKSFDKALSNISFPVLIKPIRGKGGVGIKPFDSPLELKHYCSENINSEEFIIQSFINGYDIDCSVLCQEGEILAHTIQRTTENESHKFGPSGNIDIIDDKSTYDVARELVFKLKWSGIVHIDLRYDEHDRQVKVIEMNPRYWATLIGSLSAGVNFPYLACLNGLNVDFPKVSAKPIRFVLALNAIKRITLGLFRKNQLKNYFYNSALQFIIKDPLPVVFIFFSEIYKKISPKR